MVAHSALTGSDLHEPKGADAASVDTTYISNGAGTGVWKKPDASKVTVADPNNVFTATDVEAALYEVYQIENLVEGQFASISAAETILLPVPFSCKVVSITFILAGTITTANDTVTITRSDGAAMGSQVIAFSGSAEGTTFVFTPSGNDTFTSPTHKYIKLVNSGGSTGAFKCYVQARLKRV